MKMSFKCFILFLSLFCFFYSNTYAINSKSATVISSKIEKSPGIQGGVINRATRSSSCASKGATIISSRIEKSPGVQGGVIDISHVNYGPNYANARAYAPRINAHVNQMVTLQSSHYITIENNTDKIQNYNISYCLQKADGKHVDYKATVQVAAHGSYYDQKNLYMNSVIYQQVGTYNVYAITDVSGESSSHAKDTGYVSVSGSSFSLMLGK